MSLSPLRIRLWALVLAVLATGLVAAWVVGSALVEERREDARIELSADAREIAAVIEHRIAVAETVFFGLQGLLTPAQGRAHPIEGLCEHALLSPEVRTFQRFLVADTQGNALCATFDSEAGEQQAEALREREHFQRALETRLLQFSGPFEGVFTGRPLFIAGKALVADGAPIAVAMAAFDAPLLLEFEVDLPSGSSLYAVDASGSVAQLSPGALISAVALPSEVRDSLAAARLTANCRAVDAGADVWACADIRGTDQAVVLAAPAEELYTEARSFESAWRLGAAIFALVTVGAGLMLDLGLVRRLLQLHRLARLPRPASLDALSRDEVDGLLEWAGAIETRHEEMAERLQAFEDGRVTSERELVVAVAQAVESRHPGLRDHGDRVCLYARAIGQRIGLPDPDLDLAGFAAQVHDVGKLVVPDAIYLKPGALDPVERSQMQLHAPRGQEILDRLHSLPPAVGQAVRHHHERWDGQGYPDGLRGEAIPLWARVISVADSYDAMTEERPYRPARSHDEAVAILRAGGGSQWDRELVGAFLDVLGEGTVEPKSGPQELLEAVGQEIHTQSPPAVRALLAPESPASPLTSYADGRYTIRDLLGEGAKKRVYLAHDTLLDRDVAFALIRTEGLDEIGRERILREAQAMGKLGAHPNIVTVFDLGEHDGQPYIVTELLDGDVEQLLVAAGGALPVSRALDIAKDVCRGLDYAHRNGIVHRDMKPGNVWLAENGTAKIGDFGIALSLDRTRLTRDAITPTGTVSYMPPEQVVGGEVTPRSDLYSLGAMLYELVTGRPPFMSDDAWAVASQQLMSDPTTPSSHTDGCPADLEALIMRLLQKSPDDRPESAAEVLNILESIETEGQRAQPSAVGPASP